MDERDYAAYVEFDSSHAQYLRQLAPFVEEHKEEIIEDFYRRVNSHAFTKSIIAEESQFDRLKQTLRVWLRELLAGPWDAAYAVRRRRIGQVHVDQGVGHGSMFMAMAAVQMHLCRIAAEHCASPCKTIEAIVAVTNLDLALMTGTYHNVRQERMVRDTRALLVAHMPAFVILVDRQQRVQAVTPATEEILRASFTLGARFEEVVPKEILEATALQTYLTRAIESGNEVKLPRVDVMFEHAPMYLSITIVPFFEASGGAIVHLEDHSVVLETERRLRKQQALAQLGTMSATIAHELRNPLAGISGALQVISAGMAKDDSRAAIMGKIIDQVKSLNRLVTDLLSFAKQDEVRPQTGVDLAALCEEVVTMIASDFPEVDFSIEGQGIVLTDPDLASQILMNLAMNASQAMDGKGKVLFQILPHRLIVADSGRGLSPEVRNRMFEPFYTTKLRGTGLGLPISLKLARLMDAELNLLEEGPLPGACFELRFFVPLGGAAELGGASPTASSADSGAAPKS